MAGKEYEMGMRLARDIWVDEDGDFVRYPHCADNGKPIPVEKKISFKRYMKICWENSRTNLHYIDFCARYEQTMKRMFKPVKFIKIDGIGSYLSHYGVAYREVERLGLKFYMLNGCLFDPSHDGHGDASIIFNPADRRIIYRCFHDSCKGRTFGEAIAVICGKKKR